MAKSREAFRTISEVSDWLETPAHVLRFWESRFSQIKPIKRAGGRRYYRPNDMLLLGGIRRLLHDDGITIKGVQKILREKGVRHVSLLSLDQLNGAATKDDAKVAAEMLPREEAPVQVILNRPEDAYGAEVSPPAQPAESTATTAPDEVAEDPAPISAPDETTRAADPIVFETSTQDDTAQTPQAPAQANPETRILELYAQLQSLRNRVRASMAAG
jgi:resuscitation-promoting factor RpfA